MVWDTTFGIVSNKTSIPRSSAPPNLQNVCYITHYIGIDVDGYIAVTEIWKYVLKSRFYATLVANILRVGTQRFIGRCFYCHQNSPHELVGSTKDAKSIKLRKTYHKQV